MSPGPSGSLGFRAALPAAKRRGHVECFRRRRGFSADLMVSGSGILAIVRLRFAERLHAAPADIAAEFRDAIARLRLHPAGGPVSRELWLYSRYGVLRFFRIGDSDIRELGPDGNLLQNPGEVPL